MLNAVGVVFSPDINARRRLRKEAIKQQKASVVRHEDRVYAEPAFASCAARRCSPRRTCFHPRASTDAIDDEPQHRGAERVDALLRLQAALHGDPSLLRSALSRLRASSTSRSARSSPICAAASRSSPAAASRSATRRGSSCCAPARSSSSRRAFPATPPRATRRSPISPSGAIGSRSSDSTCATRRASRRSATSCSTTRDRLDFIINNACQTVRRPPEFYEHMMEGEARVAARHARARRASCSAPTRGCAAITCFPKRTDALAPQPRRAYRRSGRAHARGAAVAGRAACPRSRQAQKDLFPEGRLDQDLQQVDLRGRNSWRLLMAEVSSVELLEVQLVNADRAVHHQRAAQAADAAHAGARQAHRERLGRGGTVLPALQDHAASAHEHGEGRAQHDDAHVRDGLLHATAST